MHDVEQSALSADLGQTDAAKFKVSAEAAFMDGARQTVDLGQTDAVKFEIFALLQRDLLTSAETNRRRLPGSRLRGGEIYATTAAARSRRSLSETTALGFPGEILFKLLRIP
jgi:hypothetical protein